MRDTIDMAREAGIDEPESDWMYWKAMERFADIVRADERNRTWTQEHWTEYERSIAAVEREACAKVVDAAKADKEDWDSNDWNQAVEFCASRIRARGNT